MVVLHTSGRELRTIAMLLNENGTAARRGGQWHASVLSLILEREGHHDRKRFKKSAKPQRICDNAQAAERARQLREEGLSLRHIGRKLSETGLAPTRGGEWHAATVAEPLTYRNEADPASAAKQARELRQHGRSLRDIAGQLMQEGHMPPRGGRWHHATIAKLLNWVQPEPDQG